MTNTQPQLLTDILNHLTDSPEARKRFNSREISGILEWTIREKNGIQFDDNSEGGISSFCNLPNSIAISVIQTALSNTPDGRAVCEFLSMESKIYKNLIGITINDCPERFELGRLRGICELTPKKLNHLLYHTFTTAIFHGKDFETALEETNTIYIENLN